MTMTINIENERKRAEFFQERGITVHISKNDGRFHNGLILEVGSDFFFIKDRVKGNEIMVFFRELKKPIEKFTEVGR